MPLATQTTDQPTKAQERNMFLFLAVFLAPIVAVLVVSGLGFAIWMSQLIFGPPGV